MNNEIGGGGASVDPYCLDIKVSEMPGLGKRMLRSETINNQLSKQPTGLTGIDYNFRLEENIKQIVEI